MKDTDTKQERASGGSGGAATKSTTTHPEFVDGRYSLAANQVELLSRAPAPPAAPDECVITLLAANNPAGTQGHVDVRGAKGVRITTGPAAIPMVSPSTSGSSTDGVEIIVSATQSVKIHRGITPCVQQMIEMTPNNILIDAGMTGTLTLMAGLSSITIDAQGVTIVGMPFVQINPTSPPPTPPAPEPGDYEPPTGGTAVA